MNVSFRFKSRYFTHFDRTLGDLPNEIMVILDVTSPDGLQTNWEIIMLYDCFTQESRAYTEFPVMERQLMITIADEKSEEHSMRAFKFEYDILKQKPKREELVHEKS
jgi:hypothetical protein